MTHHPQTRNSQSGFTLVELAIALMVIGLLIGGVLKGQELIENARITAFVKQMKDFDTAALIFRNTYGALPGDIKRPNRIPNCTDEVCSLGGNGNGSIYFQDTSPMYIEDSNFFPHLVKAGMLQGPTGGTAEEMAAAFTSSTAPERELFFPAMPMGQMFGFADKVYYVGTTTRQIARIDTKMDDGKPYSGPTVRTEECQTEDVDGVTEYDLKADDYLCGSWIGSENAPAMNW